VGEAARGLGLAAKAGDALLRLGVVGVGDRDRLDGDDALDGRIQPSYTTPIAPRPSVPLISYLPSLSTVSIDASGYALRA
jgi:hypothetical protein